MATKIVNGAPMTLFEGTNDVSSRVPVIEAEQIPQHLPKVYIFAETGPTDPQLVVGDSLVRMYGENTFDLKQPWSTHQTAIAKVFNTEGNWMMVERLIPLDAAPRANFRLYLDVLQTKLDDYKRNDDGSVVTDALGQPVLTGEKINGYKVKWVAAYIPTAADGSDLFGQGTETAGDQVDTATGTQSTRYPIMDFEVSHIGSAGNNLGLRIWTSNVNSSDPVDENIVKNQSVYPVNFACVQRDTSLSSAKVVASRYSEQNVTLCVKPDVRSDSNVRLYIGDMFLDHWQVLHPTDSTPPLYGPFGRVKVYNTYIDKLVKQFYQAEKPFIDSFSDFTGAVDEEYRFNIFGGFATSGVKYHSFQINTMDANALAMSEKSTIYATGGSDGTMNEAVFAELVETAVDRYLDPADVYQDMVTYPESFIWDSGFPLKTKYALCKFISVRKDTVVVLSTHDVLGKKLSAEEESALATALRTHAQMYPESSTYGTAAMRCMIVGRSGILLDSDYQKRLPITIEVAQKVAKYMGAATGKWVPVEAFDSAPKNEITMFGDINITWTPATVRNKDWDNGLVWIEKFTRQTAYIPAMKTVFGDDTSVLTSFFTVTAIAYLEKIGNKARMRYSGTTKLSNGQLKKRIEEDVLADVDGIFDDRFTIVPEVTFTAADLARGYSWVLTIKIYAENMKLVQRLVIEAHRSSDLTTTS